MLPAEWENKRKSTPSKRDMDLENDVGNYIITDFQLHRLQERLAGRVSTFPHKSSEVMYRTESGDWVQISIDVKRFTVRPQEEVKEEDPNPNNAQIVEPDPNTTALPFFLVRNPDPPSAGLGGIVIMDNTANISGEIHLSEGIGHVLGSGLPRQDRVAELDSEDEGDGVAHP